MSMRFAVMLFIVPVLLAVALKKPLWGLYSAMLLYYFRPGVWNEPDWWQPVYWLSICTIIGWAMKAKALKITPALVTSAILILAMLISSLTAWKSTPASISTTVVIIKLVTVQFLIVQLIQTPKDVRDFIWANVIFNLWTLKSVVVISLRGGDADRANVSAAQGGGANYLAMVFCMGLPILYFGFLHGRKLEKRLAMIIAPLTLFAIVGTGSRGGFLTLLCVVAFLAVRSRRIFAGFGTVLAMGLLLFLVTPEEKWERYMTIFRGDEERGHAAQSRLDLWKAGLKMFRQSPVTGVGHDNFSLLSARYVGYFAGDTPVAYDPALDGQKGFTGFVCHNTFIQSLAEGGLIGSIPFFLLFIMYFVNCYRARRVPLLPDSKREIWILSQVLEGTMWAFIVSSIFGSHFKIDFLWWYFGASTALYLTARRLQVIEAQITEEAQPPPAEARTWGLSNVPVRS